MIFIFIAAALWGITNPFLKKYSKGFEKNDEKCDKNDIKTKNKGPKHALRGFLNDLKFLLSRPKYLITQALNLCGSVAFNYALRVSDVSVVSVVTNSMAFVFTVITSVIVMKESVPRVNTWVGIVMVLVGVALCSMSKI
eukprot:Tbor_TRINITY_DN5997_c0_g3::TRINITY_DN5997_c0_g3_i1::g.18967::m.18967